MTVRKMLRILPALALVAGLAGCNSSYVNATPEQAQKVLMDASNVEMEATAPDTFQARFETTKGPFVVEVVRDLSPHGADRFYNLVRHRYYDGNKFFRVLPGFIVQWGMNGDVEINKLWSEQTIPDDEVATTNARGTITFAKPSSPDSRSTHLFVNYKDNGHLDATGFAPFGRVIEGMEVLEQINHEYGQTPNQGMIASGGNDYLETYYPNLDAITTARIVVDGE